LTVSDFTFWKKYFAPFSDKYNCFTYEY